MTAKELEDKVNGLQKQISEMEDAFRRLSQENNNLVGMIAKLSDDLGTTKIDVTNMKRAAEAKAKAEAKAGITKY